jgi:starch phosphorylase
VAGARGPVGHVTNGIHSRSVIAPSMAALFDRYFPPDWRDRIAEPEVWNYAEHIPDEELWRTHVDLRVQLVSYVRQRLAWQASRRHAPPHELDEVRGALNPDALTIGFARRFATYKRATLLFSDLDRLIRLLHDAERPVQFIFSGKAHPADQPAKEFIKKIANTLKDERFEHAIVFLEDYDIDVARRMVQGVDVWLNNPQRPREASGTSGMKLVPNGGLNCSILDGWWAEAYDPEVGWAIGNGEDYAPERDAIEANALYDILENQVIPTFYGDRDARGVPRRWVRMMKTGMVRLAARFSTDRMVEQYVDDFYLPAAAHFLERSQGDRESTEAISVWKRKVSTHWPEVRVLNVEGSSSSTRVGEAFRVTARVRLGHLAPADIQAQVYHGPVDARSQLTSGTALAMKHVGESDGEHRFEVLVPLVHSGRHGYTVRVVPHHPKVMVPNEITEIRWAD